MRWCLRLALPIAIAAPGVAFAQEEAPPPPPADTPAPSASSAEPAPAPPPPPATVQPEPAEAPLRDETTKPKLAPGFGRRASFVFSLENFIGFVSESSSSERTESTDQNGIFPGTFGPRIGFHHINVDSGFTYGIGLGFAVLRLGSSQSSSSDTYLAMSLLPRLGYAGSLGPRAGFWIRGGPSFRTLVAMDDDDDSVALVGLGGEAYLVFTPTEHFGVTVGPAVDFGIVGDSGGHSLRFTSLGLEVGLLADL